MRTVRLPEISWLPWGRPLWMENSEDNSPSLTFSLFTPSVLLFLPSPASLSVLKSPPKPNTAGKAFVFYFKRPSYDIHCTLSSRKKPSAPNAGWQSPNWALNDHTSYLHWWAPFSKFTISNFKLSSQGPFTPSRFHQLLLYWENPNLQERIFSTSFSTCTLIFGHTWLLFLSCPKGMNVPVPSQDTCFDHACTPDLGWPVFFLEASSISYSLFSNKTQALDTTAHKKMSFMDKRVLPTGASLLNAHSLLIQTMQA